MYSIYGRRLWTAPFAIGKKCRDGRADYRARVIIVQSGELLEAAGSCRLGGYAIAKIIAVATRKARWCRAVTTGEGRRNSCFVPALEPPRGKAKRFAPMTIGRSAKRLRLVEKELMIACSGSHDRGRISREAFLPQQAPILVAVGKMARMLEME